jgi:hypothetical protein
MTMKMARSTLQENHQRREYMLRRDQVHIGHTVIEKDGSPQTPAADTQSDEIQEIQEIEHI